MHQSRYVTTFNRIVDQSKALESDCLNLYRINLRGPWSMTLRDGALVAERNFHRPPNGTRMDLVILHAEGYPIDELKVNDTPVPLYSQSDKPKAVESPETMVGRGDVTAILKEFNAIKIIWHRWPVELQQVHGNPDNPNKTMRYIPNPSHSLHADSWLEIQE